MKDTPIILHIELGAESVYEWMKENKYVIFSELIRYAEKMLEENLDIVQALMISNVADNIVFILKKDNLELTLNKAFDYFLDNEEYEKCAKIRDLNILIQKLKNETKDSKNSERNKKQSKIN